MRAARWSGGQGAHHHRRALRLVAGAPLDQAAPGDAAAPALTAARNASLGTPVLTVVNTNATVPDR